MLHASGIGTYLRQLLPRIIDQRPDDQFRLLGARRSLAEQGWTRNPRVEIANSEAPIYSVREQVEIVAKSPRGKALFWSPHYNIPLLHRGPLVATVHDVLHLARPEFVSGKHRRLYARAMFAALKAKADAVLCDSRFTADELMRLVGIQARRIHVVHLGVDPFWGTAPAEASPKVPYLLFVGNLKPHKNLSGALDAFAALCGHIPHSLVVLGKREGFLTGDGAAQRRALQLGERVRFTGQVSDAELRQYYAHADALLLPSFYEGFGLPPLEAMAAGCPVIVSRTASLPEVCGEAALYCDPYRPADIAAQVRRLLADAVLRQELKDAGRERARQFRWDRCAQETGQVIGEWAGRS